MLFAPLFACGFAEAAMSSASVRQNVAPKSRSALSSGARTSSQLTQTTSGESSQLTGSGEGASPQIASGEEGDQMNVSTLSSPVTISEAVEVENVEPPPKPEEEADAVDPTQGVFSLSAGLSR
ncbi:unnamed protein product [Amoebophrya sp. A25]|nr:unnamed protein product [Amoebophrya sp. A25]|eukprot:GSA25T00008104001.1